MRLKEASRAGGREVRRLGNCSGRVMPMLTRGRAPEVQTVVQFQRFLKESRQGVRGGDKGRHL